MPLEIVEFQEEHLQDAALLLTARYRTLREEVLSLPSRYENVSVIRPLLHDLARQGPGVAAIRKGRLVGFLQGMLLASFRGKRAMLSPEWANTADPEDSRRIYQEMYARLSTRWVANGCFTHLVCTLAHDRDGIDGWHWLGFGMIAVDGVRDLALIPGAIVDVEIRRAGSDDLEQAMALGEALQRHLASGPTFLAMVDRDDRQFHEEWLANPRNALWMAFRGGEAIACMGLGPANPEACHIIRDDKTTSITRAFTEAQSRNRGIAGALLSRSLEWARSEGYERCAVDFEPMNILAARFWTRYFRVVCYALVRHVDERVAWAHEKRAAKDMW